MFVVGTFCPGDVGPAQPSSSQMYRAWKAVTRASPYSHDHAFQKVDYFAFSSSNIIQYQ